MIVSFSIFRRCFHNKTIVFLKNENINIPICMPNINQTSLDLKKRKF